jgi:hypothetical protein
MNFLETVEKKIKSQIVRMKLDDEISRYLGIINNKGGRVELGIISQTDADLWAVPVDAMNGRVSLEDVYGTLEIISMPGEKIEAIFRNSTDEIEGVVKLFGQENELSVA